LEKVLLKQKSIGGVEMNEKSIELNLDLIFIFGIIIFSLVDVITTIFILANGGQELNLFLNFFTESLLFFAVFLCLIKVLAITLLIWLAKVFVGYHNELSTIVLCSFCSISCFVCVHNLINILFKFIIGSNF